MKERVEAQRVLSSEDFAQIKRLKKRFEEARRDPRRVREGGKEGAGMGKVEGGKEQVLLMMAGGKKRGREAEEEEGEGDEGGMEGRMKPEDLEGYKKRKRACKEERLMKIVAGKSAFEHAGHAGGLTNTEKKRKKNYMMVRKGKRSVFSKLRDTQQERKIRKVKGKKSEYSREARKRRRC